MLPKPSLEIDALRQKMFRRGQAFLHIAVEIGRIICPGRRQRGRLPRPTHRLKGKERISLSQTFLQPEVGRIRRATSSMVITKKGQDMDKLVRELKAVLRPIRIAGRQAHSNTTIPIPFEVGLGMIASAIDLYAVQIYIGTLLPNLLSR